MQFRLNQIFGAGPLFVERNGFSSWLAEASAKSALLGTADSVRAAMAVYSSRDRQPTVIGDTAVIDMCGPIVYRSSWLSSLFGMSAIEDLRTKFRGAMADAGVRTIVFRVDSPGGVIDGVPELADELFAARKRGKRIVAVADTLVASAAYWLVSQVDEVFATTSSQLGAIGVFLEHVEYSRMLDAAGVTVTLISYGDHKVDGNSVEPLSDAARRDLQASVNEVGGWFDAAVARGRGVSTSVVRSKFGQGRVFRGQRAISLGLADRADTLESILSGSSARASMRTSAYASRLSDAEQAEVDEEHAIIAALLGR